MGALCCECVGAAAVAVSATYLALEHCPHQASTEQTEQRQQPKNQGKRNTLQNGKKGVTDGVANKPKQKQKAKQNQKQMASRGATRGLDRDLADKRASSYDTRLERELRTWIEGVTGERSSGTFHQYLRSGVVLCKFVHHLFFLPSIPPLPHHAAQGTHGLLLCGVTG